MINLICWFWKNHYRNHNKLSSTACNPFKLKKPFKKMVDPCIWAVSTRIVIHLHKLLNEWCGWNITKPNYCLRSWCTLYNPSVLLAIIKLNSTFQHLYLSIKKSIYKKDIIEKNNVHILSHQQETSQTIKVHYFTNNSFIQSNYRPLLSTLQANTDSYIFFSRHKKLF